MPDVPRRKVVRREMSQRVQVYLQPSVAQERMILDMIAAGRDGLRMPDFLRGCMLEGFRAKLARGDVPPELLEVVPAAGRLAEALAAAQGVTLPVAVPRAPPLLPAPRPSAVREPEPEPPEVTVADVADMLDGLM